MSDPITRLLFVVAVRWQITLSCDGGYVGWSSKHWPTPDHLQLCALWHQAVNDALSLVRKP